MERCPNCRARGDGTATCRRCGMDLATLIRIDEAAERLLAQGVAHLVAGDPVAAQGTLTRVPDLRAEPLAELLLGFAQTLAEERRQHAPGAAPASLPEQEPL